jgi:YggT family protein
MPGALELVARVVIVAALAYAAVVAATHWAVRSRRIGPFGPWPRAIRRASDPLLLPIERRVMRAGGSPQDAPVWLLGIVVVGGLILISFVRWLIAAWYHLTFLAGASPRVWVAELLSWVFTILIVALIVRVVASWFGVATYHRWYRVVLALTDWLVRPIQRVVPPVGIFDLSPLIAYFVLWILRQVVFSVLRF